MRYFYFLLSFLLSWGSVTKCLATEGQDEKEQATYRSCCTPLQVEQGDLSQEDLISTENKIYHFLSLPFQERNKGYTVSAIFATVSIIDFITQYTSGCILGMHRAAFEAGIAVSTAYLQYYHNNKEETNIPSSEG